MSEVCEPFREAIKLIQEFFPESQDYISDEKGIYWEAFLESMSVAGLSRDCSCESYGNPPGPDRGLSGKGGFDGYNEDVYHRLLGHTGFFPSGRAVVIPDTFGKDFTVDEMQPFICDFQLVAGKLSGIDHLFTSGNDVLFVFESGESFLLDHDDRFYWSKSKSRNWEDHTSH